MNAAEFVVLGLVGQSGGRGVSAQVRQYFDRLMPTPTPTHQMQLATMIDGAFALGAYQQLDAWVPHAVPDTGTSLVNIISNSFKPTIGGVDGDVTFAPDQGWSGIGAASFIDPNYNPSTAGGKLTQNSAMVCAWSLTATQQNKFLWFTNSADRIGLQPYNLSGNIQVALNSASPQSVANPNATAKGFFLANRSSAANFTIDHNGVQVGSAITDTSQALENGTLWTVPAPIVSPGYAMGGEFTPTQRVGFHALWLAYNQARGLVFP